MSKQICTLLVLFFWGVVSLSAQVKVTGKVTDEMNSPLPGANIMVKGTKSGVVSDFDGNYEIQVQQGDILEFSFIGFQTQSQKVIGGGKHLIINVVLQEDTQQLEDVVVVGYGTQKKENLTGAVSQVKMAEVLGDRPVVNTSSALQGAVAGLQVTRNPTPGQNGNTLQIRGNLSINGGGPLVLIDNVPGDIGSLNPEDIESVTVLKDAASSAIYGARAAGGVVLITTKRPSSGTKFQFNYNYNIGFEKSINKPKQASLYEYFEAYQEAGFPNAYWANSQDVTKWVQYLKEYRENPSKFNIIGDGIYVDPSGIPYYLHEKDLYDNILSTGLLQTHNVSVSGGTDKLRYRMSGGYNHEDGPLITDKDSYKRKNLGAFISADIANWFTQEVDVRYSESQKTNPQGAHLYSLRLISYYPEGNFPASVNIGSNKDLPLITPRNSILGNNTSVNNGGTTRIFSKSIFKPFEGFTGIFEYTFNKTDNRHSHFSNKWIHTSIQGGETSSPTKDVYRKDYSFTNYNSVNAYGTYTKDILKNHFSLMAGFSQESSYYEIVRSTAESQNVPTVPSFGGATENFVITDGYSEYTIRSGFFRFNYNYDRKYLLEINGRYDGSSKFPKNSRFGFFPSASLGWQVSRENFMAFSENWLNEFKLRASWGQIGNQNINPYQYSPTLGVYKSNEWSENFDRITAMGLPSLVSNSFTWETVTSINFGADFGFFNNRLRATFDIFQRDTKDMLTEGVVQLPAVVGIAAPSQNSATMHTKGWEFEINWKDKIGDFGYRIGVNLFDNQSKLTKFETNKSRVLFNGKGEALWYEGRDFGEIWGYVADGYYSVDDFADVNSWKLKDGVTSVKNVNVRPGDMKFRNLRDDEHATNRIDNGKNTADDPGDMKVIGNSSLRYQYSANFGVNYKGFDLNVMLQGIGKRDVWIGGQAIFPFAPDGQFNPLFYNQTDYWRAKSYDPSNPDYMVAVNPNATYYRIYGQGGNAGHNRRTSDKFLQDASYLRIKNITLSYAFQKPVLEILNVSQLRFFIGVENLATFSSLPKGIDPERINWGYPFSRIVSFGGSLTF
ncbi:SusC/RagA family TonB-linked outer membrane protein [Capnocytophaga canimorsus]|uniref:SusC/RagA family TonB-linked outer membrane protein n=1 Tax=Capnocytophaga canimorsus TaxID=28188 RepID=UPI001ACBE4FC|nr:TonB-dependent receptor [Capnocytophaga canimorsus]GIM59377.1 SusC/RagA family TonB-linked outer membrane protein [Capnocytophaga canimorsus]